MLNISRILPWKIQTRLQNPQDQGAVFESAKPAAASLGMKCDVLITLTYLKTALVIDKSLAN